MHLNLDYSSLSSIILKSLQLDTLQINRPYIYISRKKQVISHDKFISKGNIRAFSSSYHGNGRRHAP